MADSLPAGQAKGLSLGKVIGAALPSFSTTHRLPTHHWKVLRALAACHTEALGGHRYRCTHCGQEHFAPNGCGNRHCPSCQKLESAQWLERQLDYLLPIPYFHVVFTLPHALNPLIEHNQKALYNLLFSSASGTLLEFGRNELHATLGITAVLHTWSQNLRGHYHLHCVVTGGGLSLDGKSWIPCRSNWLFPVRALSEVFRGKVRDSLQKLFKDNKLQLPASAPDLAQPAGRVEFVNEVCGRPWVVYAKPPFASPKSVLAYLCRYTHRVAITDSRLEALDRENGTVRFTYKDYAHQSQIRSMTVRLEEFLQRFCWHILPERFVKIRHYGLLSNRGRATRIAQAQALLAQKLPAAVLLAFQAIVSLPPVEPAPLVCPHCGRATLELIEVVPRPETLPPLDSS